MLVPTARRGMLFVDGQVKEKPFTQLDLGTRMQNLSLRESSRVGRFTITEKELTHRSVQYTATMRE